MNKKLFIASLAALTYLLLMPITPAYCVDNSLGMEFYIYGVLCVPCKGELLPEVAQTVASRVVFYDLEMEPDNVEYYQKIIDLVAPGAYLIPLIGVFRNDDLNAIVIGNLPGEVWEGIIENDHEGVPVYLSGGIEPIKILRDQMIELLEKLFTKVDSQAPEPTWQLKFFSFLPLVVFAAAADAVNPCEFHVLVVLLAFVFFNVGKKAVLKTGLAFTAAIFIGYYLMGVGLLRILARLPQIRYGIVVFGLAVGALKIMDFLGEKRKIVPSLFVRKISRSLERAISPPTAFLAGVVVSICLLPCSSAPYLVVLDLIAEKATLFEGLALLATYNAIIIIPLLTITLGVHALGLTTLDMKMWLSEKGKWLSLFAGSMMIFLSLLLAFL